MGREKFILCFCATISFLLISCDITKKEETAQSSTEEIFPIDIAPVSLADNQETISSVGTIRFRRETSLGFTTSGKVATVRYNEGDRAKRGALLAALDTTSVKADINVANAELERSKSEFDRISTLFKQGWVTKSRLEQSKASYQAAMARVEQANFATDTASLFAPSDGVIIERNIDPGQIISAGNSALIFGQFDSGYILRVPLTSSNASKVNVGMPVQVSISSIPDEIFSASVTEVESRADDRTGSFFAMVELPTEERFRSGQIGTANFIIASGQKNIVIPSSAISGIRGTEGIVYVYDGNKKRVFIKNVMVGELDDHKINILKGLSLNDQVVIKGHEKLSNASKVNIVDRSTSKKSVNLTNSETVQ